MDETTFLKFESVKNLDYSISDDLSKIEIGNNIKKIEISLVLLIPSIETDSDLLVSLEIFRNNSKIAMTGKSISGFYESIYIHPCIVDVEEGDTIDIRISTYPDAELVIPNGTTKMSYVTIKSL